MADKKWYVVHVYSGFEKKIAQQIKEQAAQKGLGEQFDEILVPSEEVTEVRRGQKVNSERKFFPGYVLIQMALYDEHKQLMEKPWSFIQATPGLIGFIGGDRPVALRPDEVAQILQQIEEKKERVKPKVVFEPGESVKITDGPFLSFSGIVEEVDPERGKLKVSVSIFGRTAPVELEYWQVERGE